MSVLLNIRLEKEERELIKNAASRLGLTMSDFIRQFLLPVSNTIMDYEPGKEKELLDDIGSTGNAITTNLRLQYRLADLRSQYHDQIGKVEE